MTLGVFTLQNDTLVAWSAAAPPFLVIRGGVAEAITVPGEPLGSSNFAVNRREIPFPPDSRAMLFTDGLLEITPRESRRQLGLKGVRRLFVNSSGSLAHMQRSIATAITEAARDVELADDVTVVLVQARPGGRTS